jgi:hypothetical protein
MCMEVAASRQSPEIKRLMIEMARVWHELAQEREETGEDEPATAA